MSAPPTTKRLRHESLLPAALAQVLDRVRRRHLTLKLLEFPVMLLAGLASAWLIQALADRVFDLPWSARCVLLTLDAIGAAWLFHRFVILPWKSRFDRKGAALFVERSLPEFRTSLISAVEFSAPDSDTPVTSKPLVERLVSDVAQRVASMDVVQNVVSPEHLKRLAMRCTAPVLVVLLLLIVCRPVSGLLLRRILLSGESLPTATTVVSITGDQTVSEGGELSLAALAAGEIPLDGKLVITYPNGPSETLQVAASGDLASEFRQVMKNIRQDFSYRFILNDGTGPEHKVIVRFPPAPRTLGFVVDPPAYTGLTSAELAPTSLKLLEGSTLHLEGSSTKPLNSARLHIEGTGETVSLAVDSKDATRFSGTILVPAEGWKSLSVHLAGTDGDESANDAVYPVELVRDRPPTVTLHMPKDESSTVVANDKVPIVFEAVDDFGFSSARLVYQVFRMLPDGNSEQAGEGEIGLEPASGEKTWKHRLNWNLGLLMPPVTTGYSISFSIETTDNKTEAPGTGHSSQYTLNVISEQEKRLELLDLLGTKAAEIERLYEQQKSIHSRTEGNTP